MVALRAGASGKGFHHVLRNERSVGRPRQSDFPAPAQQGAYVGVLPSQQVRRTNDTCEHSSRTSGLYDLVWVGQIVGCDHFVEVHTDCNADLVQHYS